MPAQYYEWSERYLNSRASDNIIDTDTIDTTIDFEWSGSHTFDGFSGSLDGSLDLSGEQLTDSTGSIELAVAQNLAPSSEPAAPTSGVNLFVDSTDGNLKAKDTNGSVTTVLTVE